MQIRDASLNDAQPIAALHAASWQNTYAKVLRPKYLNECVPSERGELWQKRLSQPSPNQRVLVALESDQLVGFACAFIDEHPTLGSYLENLHVIKNAHGRGIGKQLIREVAAICARYATSPALYLSVNQDNERAQYFYLSLGATNAAAAVWNAPDGSDVPTYRFEWSSVTELAEKAANSAVNWDCLGAAHSGSPLP